jgi:soluble lytic murein transglycosylase-like protein
MLEQFQGVISKYAAEFQVPEVWIKAVIMAESSGRVDAYRPEPSINDASYGLMQLLYRTARSLGYAGAPEGLYDPDTNIRLGTKLLGTLRARFGDDLRAVYSAYNSGSGTAYTTNPQVASNVSRVLGFVEDFLYREPVIASAGALGLLIVGVFLWYWGRTKGKSKK